MTLIKGDPQSFGLGQKVGYLTEEINVFQVKLRICALEFVTTPLGRLLGHQEVRPEED